MRRRATALLVALLCVTAGCVASSASPRDAGASPATAVETTSPAPGAASDASEATSDASDAGSDERNPWREETLTVAVVAGDAERATDSEFAPLVRRAASFWAANAERYAGYAVDFRVAAAANGSGADDADVVVHRVDDVETCGNATNPVGCAPTPNGTAPARPAVVEVESGLTERSTVRVLKHEFGHLLGLRHGDAPRGLMQSAVAVTTAPRRNATDRAFPWADRRLTVAVDAADASSPAERRTVRDEVAGALGFVEQSAALPAVQFDRVDAAADADVVIRVAETPADGDACACFRLRGPDPDRDGAPERYRRLTVTLRDLDPETAAWHVGNWLSYALGAESPGNRPAPFRDDSAEQRRDDAWHDGN
ncbi:matrixin family metalloprotease [Halobaculum sp. D14]|uniref:matrixin family metalloprotease n=1 Tax=Halobaculum sp. D14 TaxID=3421642 RepID=UPI003EBF791E